MLLMVDLPKLLARDLGHLKMLFANLSSMQFLASEDMPVKPGAKTFD